MRLPLAVAWCYRSAPGGPTRRDLASDTVAPFSIEKHFMQPILYATPFVSLS